MNEWIYERTNERTNEVTLLHPAALSHLKITNRSLSICSSQQHVTCGTVFLLPSVFLISQLRHTAPHHHPLIHDWLFTCLMGSFILVSKLASCPGLLHSLQSLPRTDSMECWHPVFGSLWHLKYWRMRQIKPAAYNIILLTYLLTYAWTRVYVCSGDIPWVLEA